MAGEYRATKTLWQRLQHASIPEVIDWARTQTWCQAMAHCQQDAQWHAEGDVWTHTQSVLTSLEELDEWPSLSPDERSLLVFTALLHDVAKPITTQVDEETGRVRSPKHAVKGEQLAREILRAMDCDLNTREQITRMVRYHGRPVFLMEREDPIHELIRLSVLLNNRLLYLFALADWRGRDSDSTERSEETLHYWKLLALEHECFETAYPFASDHARFVYLRQEKPDRYFAPFEQFSCRVTLMSGLPGSGKDTWLNRQRPDLPVVSLDELREEMEIDPTDNQGEVSQAARERCRELLRSGTDFAFNATNTMRLTRGRWIDLFADYNAWIEIVYLEPPLRDILAQNAGRSRVVPEQVIRRLLTKTEPPTLSECHRLTLLG